MPFLRPRSFYSGLALLLLLAGSGLLVATFALVFLPPESLAKPLEKLAGLFGDGQIDSLPDLLRSIRQAARLLALLGIALGLLGGALEWLGRRAAEAPGEGGPEGLARPASRHDRYLMLLPPALLFAWVLPTLRQGLGWDEAWTVRTAQGSWLRVLAPDEANNHLLHTFLLKVATTLAGAEEWVYRLPALAAGLLLVMLLYRSSRALGHGEANALLAAFAAATSWGTVFCASNARGYSLAAAAGAGLLLLRLHLPIPLTRGALVLFATLTAAAALTLPTALIVVAAFFFSLWPGRGPFRDRLNATRQLIAALVGSGILVLALYAWSLPSRLLYMAARRPFDDGFLDLLLKRMFAYWGPAPDTLWGGLLMAGLFGAGLFLLGRRLPAAGIFLATLIGLSIVVHWRGGYAQFWYSSLGFALAPLGLGELLERAPSRWRTAALLAAVVLIAASAYRATFLWEPRTSADRVIATLRAEIEDREGADVGVLEKTEAMLYYLEQSDIPWQDEKSDSPTLLLRDFLLNRHPCRQLEIPGFSCRDLGPATEVVALYTRNSTASVPDP